MRKLVVFAVCTKKVNKEIAVFGTGCFWCSEALFSRLKGVITAVPGFAGGTVENPSTERVHQGDTQHAEVVRIEFDTSLIPYTVLLDVFFHIHDPTSLNKQDYDVGNQYRSIILYTNNAQKNTAQNMLEKLNKTEFSGRIVTEIVSLRKFYEAESYHKQYYAKNFYQPYCQIIISPKIAKLSKKYLHLYRENKRSDKAI